MVDEVGYGIHFRQLEFALPVGCLFIHSRLNCRYPEIFFVCTNLNNLLTCWSITIQIAPFLLRFGWSISFFGFEFRELQLTFIVLVYEFVDRRFKSCLVHHGLLKAY